MENLNSENSASRKTAQNDEVLNEEELNGSEFYDEDLNQENGDLENNKKSPQDTESDLLQKKIEERINNLIEEKSALKSELLRARAELDNLHKRSQRMIEETKENSSMSIVRSFLPVFDELAHAFLYSNNISKDTLPSEVTLVLDGIKMTISKFTTILNKYGIQEVNPNIGDAFDPDFHNAVLEREDKNFAVGSIIEVFQVGYKIKNSSKLIRAASVVVSK